MTIAHYPAFIQGPAGLLQLSVSIPAESTPALVGIVCHPHPLFQGTMDNKVVTTAARALNDLGHTAVRFNYRGVGQSQGAYDAGVGEVDDLMAIVTWVQQQYPQAGLVLVGFSFGAFIAASGAARIPAVKGLLSIAPAVHSSPYDTITPLIHCPWQIIMGMEDEVVAVDDVIAFYRTVSQKASLVLLPNTTHFFHGQLLVLKGYVEQFFG